MTGQDYHVIKGAHVQNSNKAVIVLEESVGTKMNLFRLAGDLSHLLAIVILLVKIWRTRSCAGERRSCILCLLTVVLISP